MRSLDKVSEAYFGSMGETFARKTRERIHWICSKTRGKHVLDIGCSQGITAVLLAREGKQVIGIDIEEEAIHFAKEYLQNESETVKKNVNYQVCSIFDFDPDKQFDTIILSEVMEHFADSSTLLEVTRNKLSEQGTLVITVPFGINDFIDHKKTYYLVNLLDEIEPYFHVEDVKYFGKWIGVVAVKPKTSSENISIFHRSLIRELENQFYQLERSLVDDVKLKTTKMEELNKQLREIKASQDRLKQSLQEKTNLTNQLQNQVSELSQRMESHQNDLNYFREQNETLLQEYEELQSKYSTVKEKYDNLKEANGELEQTIEQKNKEILERLDSEEETLKKYKNTIFQYNQLEAKYAQISNKYKLLSHAKLGRLTLKYWKMRKRIPEDF